jgi:thioredoxin-related protein
MSRHAVLVALAVLVACGSASGEEDEKHAALVAGDWFKKGGWLDDLDKAKAESKKSGRAIFVYHTTVAQDSPFCRNLEKDIFTDEKFLEFTKKFVCYAQVHSAKRPSVDELRKSRGKAWPWFAFVDASGNLLLPLAPDFSREVFVEAGERVLRYIEVARRSVKGSESDKRDLVIEALDLGRIGIEDAHKRLAALGGATDEQKKKLAQAEANNFVAGISIATSPSDQDAILAAGRKFVDHKKQGKPLPSYRGDIQAFWLAVQKVATTDKDPVLYEEAFLALKERYGSEPSAKAFFEGCARTLEELKAAKK